MLRIFIVFSLFITQVSIGQTKFTFTEKGLAPNVIHTTINDQSSTALYQKTLLWIDKIMTNPKQVITEQVANKYIIITFINPNYINIKKEYYYVKHSTKISFDQGKCSFEPVEVFTKINSKYDMGWQPFDLKDGTRFFKKGKPIKKSRVYLDKIPELFNTLVRHLSNDLKSD